MRRAIAALSVGVVSSIATSKIAPNEWSVDGQLTGQELVVQIHPALSPDDTGLDTGGVGDTGLEAAPGDTILFDIPPLDAAECDDIAACALDYELTFDLDRPLAEGETVTLSWGAAAEVHGSGSVPIEDAGLVIEVTAPEEE
ncbi:MAG: hypothetical protein GY913_27250 [Proteobacteria bacterium]|nr:hypothetical protein [Pseudomonadota bacterium]MCP4920612.1 hypothetical protein [Pseudomonadota bacterium]